jgi:aspartyl-tRNA(Asn)/glutamyl-tRNA(Gln) amidotransferase subunit C
MVIIEDLINTLEQTTGIEITDEKRDFVASRLESILEYIGYSEPELESEHTVQDIKTTGVDDNLIKYLEELSRLRLTPEEEKRSKAELNKILEYIDMLGELDTETVEPMSHPFAYTNNFREDECKQSTDRELILKNAPQQKDGCFKVPTTVE